MSTMLENMFGLGTDLPEESEINVEDEFIKKITEGDLPLEESSLSINDLKTFYNTSDSIDKDKYPNFFEWYDYMVRSGKYHNESVEEDGKEDKKDKILNEEDPKESLGYDINEYQEWVDYDMKHYGKISDETNCKLNDAGLEVVKDDHGDYEVIAKDRKELGESSLDSIKKKFFSDNTPAGHLWKAVDLTDDEMSLLGHAGYKQMNDGTKHSYVQLTDDEYKDIFDESLKESTFSRIAGAAKDAFNKFKTDTMFEDDKYGRKLLNYVDKFKKEFKITEKTHYNSFSYTREQGKEYRTYHAYIDNVPREITHQFVSEKYSSDTKPEYLSRGIVWFLDPKRKANYELEDGEIQTEINPESIHFYLRVVVDAEWGQKDQDKRYAKYHKKLGIKDESLKEDTMLNNNKGYKFEENVDELAEIRLYNIIKYDNGRCVMVSGLPGDHDEIEISCEDADRLIKTYHYKYDEFLSKPGFDYYENIGPFESIQEDTIKKRNGKWTNRGDDGKEHGEFKTKKQADAQRRAMFANGYKAESKKVVKEGAFKDAEDAGLTPDRLEQIVDDELKDAKRDRFVAYRNILYRLNNEFGLSREVGKVILHDLYGWLPSKYESKKVTESYVWDKDWSAAFPGSSDTLKNYYDPDEDLSSQLIGAIYPPDDEHPSYGADIWDNDKADQIDWKEGFDTEEDAKKWVEDWFKKNKSKKVVKEDLDIPYDIAKNFVKYDKDGTVVSTNNNGDLLIKHDSRGLNSDVFEWSVVDKDGTTIFDTGRMYYGYEVSWMSPQDTRRGVYGDAIILKAIADKYKFNDQDILKSLDSGFADRYRSAMNIDLDPNKEYGWNSKKTVTDTLNEFTSKLDKYNRVKIKESFKLSLKEDVEETLPGPDNAEDLSLSNMISKGIKDEYDTIELYNSIALVAREQGQDDIAELIDNINTEENNHVGMLQSALKTLSKNTDAIESGDKEAKEYLDEPVKLELKDSNDFKLELR